MLNQLRPGTTLPLALLCNQPRCSSEIKPQRLSATWALLHISDGGVSTHQYRTRMEWLSEENGHTRNKETCSRGTSFTTSLSQNRPVLNPGLRWRGHRLTARATARPTTHLTSNKKWEHINTTSTHTHWDCANGWSTTVHVTARNRSILQAWTRLLQRYRRTGPAADFAKFQALAVG
jgi:hypothetical protein